jgi:hypothetical protein
LWSGSVISGVGSAITALALPLLAVVTLQATPVQMGVFVAAESYLPVILPTEELTAGNARLQTGWSVADIGGPGLAGWLVQAFSAPIAILVDGVSYLVSGALLAGIRVPKATRVPAEGAQPHFWRELLEGVRLVAGNPVLRATAAAAGI